MKNFLKNNFPILIIYILMLLQAYFFINIGDKVKVHYYLNQFVGHPFLDSFFYYITYLGDGLVAFILLFIFLLINIRFGLYAASSFIAASLTSQILKRYFFDDVNRPTFVFDRYPEYTLRLVEGVDTHIHNSFPSGHATQVFAILLCLAYVSKNKILKLLILLVAILAAYSRVYLSQHWLNDVVAGSLIGFVFSLFFYFVFVSNSHLTALNRPLFSMAKKNGTDQK